MLINTCLKDVFNEANETVVREFPNYLFISAAPPLSSEVMPYALLPLIMFSALMRQVRLAGEGLLAADAFRDPLPRLVSLGVQGSRNHHDNIPWDVSAPLTQRLFVWTGAPRYRIKPAPPARGPEGSLMTWGDKLNIYDMTVSLIVSWQGVWLTLLPWSLSPTHLYPTIYLIVRAQGVWLRLPPWPWLPSHLNPYLLARRDTSANKNPTVLEGVRAYAHGSVAWHQMRTNKPHPLSLQWVARKMSLCSTRTSHLTAEHIQRFIRIICWGGWTAHGGWILRLLNWQTLFTLS